MCELMMEMEIGNCHFHFHFQLTAIAVVNWTVIWQLSNYHLTVEKKNLERTHLLRDV
jgi:hypothetical protein